MADVIEVLEVGGSLYIPPEDEARVLLPKLIGFYPKHRLSKAIQKVIRSHSGRILAVKGQGFIHDAGKGMAQRGERSAGSDSGACTGGIEGAAAAN
jgi:hypothetical protein